MRCIVSVVSVTVLTFVESVMGGHVFLLLLLPGDVCSEDTQLTVIDLVEELKWVCRDALASAALAAIIKAVGVIAFLSRRRFEPWALILFLVFCGALNFLVSGLWVVGKWAA